MKFLASLMCLCLIVCFAGCENKDGDAQMNISPGAVSETSGCCSGSSDCTADEASLGAVKESSCSESAATCPASGG